MYDLFDLQITSPPILSQEINAVVDINLLRDIRSQICEIIDTLTEKNKFTSEFEILSNIFYKFRNQWRREKCLKFIKQAINAIVKFKTMDFVKTLENFKDLIPSRFTVITKEKLYLPTSPVFIYLFAKLLTACIIIHKAILYCILAAIEVQKQMELKLFLSYMTFSLASVSAVKYNLEILKNHVFSLYENLQQCFVSIYPSIQLPFSFKINIWYSTLFLNGNKELNTVMRNNDRNKQKAMIDLYEATGCQSNKSSNEITNKNLMTKINISKNSNSAKNKKIRLVNKVQNFLESNSGNILKDEDPIFKYKDCKRLKNSKNSACSELKNIHNSINNASKYGDKNSMLNSCKIGSNQNQFSPLTFNKNEINIFMKKCILTSKSSADVERKFHKLLKNHSDKQFIGLLISFRNFKKLNKIEKKRKPKDNKIYTNLALKIVRKFLNDNK